MVHHIKQNLNNKNIAQGLFLDVWSAFEKVWHNGLLAKLSQIGIDGSFHNLIDSYLMGRKPVVVVDGVKSDTCDQTGKLWGILVPSRILSWQ